MSVFDPNLIHPKSPHHLSYGGLNRNDMERRDPGLIKRLLAQLETRYIIVWRGLNLFKSDITGLKSMKWLTIEVVSSFLDEAICIYLGKDRSQVEYVCLDISKYPEDKLGPLSANGQFGDLREANPSISGDDGSILAYAKAMCHWLLLCFGAMQGPIACCFLLRIRQAKAIFNRVLHCLEAKAIRSVAFGDCSYALLRSKSNSAQKQKQ